jgi:N-acetylglucosamine-6-phosphate deacetylase
MLFYNGTVVLPTQTIENGFVLSRDGRITAVGRAEDLAFPTDVKRVNAHGGFIAPGYVDIHVHGGDGADFMDGTPEAVRTANRAHARCGTTSIFPTTTTGSPKQIDAMLSAVRAVQKANRIQDGARIAGVHFYGPYFAEDKVGCHLQSGRRNPDAKEYLKHFDSGLVRVATCAAELPGAEAFYKEAAARGMLVTCGHSNATWTEMARAFRAGMRHVDHFWCAMSSVFSVRERMKKSAPDYGGCPMQGSMEQFVLFHKEMSTEVIADGIHLSPELLEFAFALKGADRLCLCTDANRALGMPPGKYRFGPEADGEFFMSDGKVGYQRGRGLASSIVGMDTMVRTMKAQTSASVAEAIRMASLTPAERAGHAKEFGSLEVGKRADVLVLDQALHVQSVFIEGEEFVFNAAEKTTSSRKAAKSQRRPSSGT